MSSWFDFDPNGGWERVESRLTGITFGHAETNDTLVVIRLRGPSGRPGEYTEEYVLRYVKSPRTSWRTLVTTNDKQAFKTECREVMERLPTQNTIEEASQRR